MKYLIYSSRQIDELESKRRKIERDYRTMFIEMVQSVFEVSSDDEQKEILQDFSERFPLSAVTGNDFKQHRWASLMNWPSIKEYWADVRALPCPGFDEFAAQRGIKEIDAEIVKLEVS